MGVIVHGYPGRTLESGGEARYGRASTRRGAWFEGVTARALERWLSARRAKTHLSHDLTGFQHVEGHGYPPVSLGAANIDHVILTGRGWLMVNAKDCGSGTLGTDSRGRGVLMHADGTLTPQPWLDDCRSYSHAGVLTRLTGLKGCLVWVVPDGTSTTHPSAERARCLRYTGMIMTVGELLAGELLQSPQVADLLAAARPARASAVAALDRHVAHPAERTASAGSPAEPYPWMRPAILRTSEQRFLGAGYPGRAG